MNIKYTSMTSMCSISDDQKVMDLSSELRSEVNRRNCLTIAMERYLYNVIFNDKNTNQELIIIPIKFTFWSSGYRGMIHKEIINFIRTISTTLSHNKDLFQLPSVIRLLDSILYPLTYVSEEVKERLYNNLKPHLEKVIHEINSR